MGASDRFLRDLAAEVRAATRRDRFGGAACWCCGDTVLLHLNRLADRDICGCCLTLVQGKRTILEAHHVAGRSEGPVVEVCRNCHLELTELQRRWPLALSFEDRLDRGVGDLFDVRRVPPHPGV
ncbi:MAG: hypothetical protein M3198_14840 [Actinomycetota bacterium]|nr:hypothetical protein [Actinomycetota bacterium]